MKYTDLSELKFKGVSKLYTADGIEVGRLIVMYYSYRGNNFYRNEECYDFFSGSTGKHILHRDNIDITKVATSEFGIEYILKYKDDLGKNYFIGPIEKSIVVNL